MNSLNFKIIISIIFILIISNIYLYLKIPAETETKVLEQFICLDGVFNTGYYYSKKYNFSINESEYLNLAYVCEKLVWDEISYIEQLNMLNKLLNE